MELARRQDVPVNETWDLSLLYKTEEDMYADVEKARILTDKIVSDYKEI